MARQTGCLSFDTRDQNCHTKIGLPTYIAAGRTGYGLNCKSTGAGQDGLGVSFSTWTPAVTPTGTTVGERFDFRFRFFFQPVTLPSANGLFIGSFNPTWLRLEMNTSGQLRLVTSGVGTSYGPAVTLNHWYGVDFRWHGLWHYFAGVNANTGRSRGTVKVYDYGLTGTDAPALFYSAVSAGGFVGGIGSVGVPPGESFWTSATESAQTIANNLTAPGTYSHTVSGYSPASANGEYNGGFYTTTDSVIGPTYIPADGPITVLGSVAEHGKLSNDAGADLDLSQFVRVNNFGGLDRIAVGQVNGAGGPTCTREINYDDLYWDYRLGSDADAYWNLPIATRIYVFPPIGQGTFDQFTPAGSYGLVDDLPVDTVTPGDYVASSAVNTKTTYTHAPLADLLDFVHHVKIGSTCNSSGGTAHKLLLGTDEKDIQAIVGITDQVNEQCPTFDTTYDTPISAAAWAALEFGGKCGPAGVFAIANIWAEVLSGPPAAGLGYALPFLGSSDGNVFIDL